jgi:transcription elongation factor Elf1
VSEFDHEHTEEIVCPYCGHEFSDSWYLGPSEGEHVGSTNCESCDKEFHYSRHIEVTYCTETVESVNARAEERRKLREAARG